jgi:prepilin-type N-terminal cleavage/methylation domain-containing protein
MKIPAVPRLNGRIGRARRHGFTLVEVMIVVLIISLLAMMGRVAVQRLNLRARASAYWNDCRVFSEAFNHYAQEKGNFPPDQNGAGLFPPNMDPYLNRTQWLRKTPLGGTYDWDNKTASNSTGVKFNGAIRVNNCTWTTTNLQKIDRWFDDGNLATGNFRVTDAGATVLFVVEPFK